MTDRHSYIIEGICADTFRDFAVRKTLEDTDLTHYLHRHQYISGPGIDPLKRCNEECEMVQQGQVERVQTKMVESTTDQSGD